MWTPGRLVSKCSSTSGSSTPRSAAPNTSLIASTGHSAAHLPWPMHFDPLSSVATPPMRPMIFPSGQALMHDPLPMQTSGSITGWSDCGTWSSSFTASASFCLARRSPSQRRNKYSDSVTAANTAASFMSPSYELVSSVAVLTTWSRTAVRKRSMAKTRSPVRGQPPPHAR